MTKPEQDANARDTVTKTVRYHKYDTCCQQVQYASKYGEYHPRRLPTINYSSNRPPHKKRVPNEGDEQIDGSQHAVADATEHLLTDLNIVRLRLDVPPPESAACQQLKEYEHHETYTR